MAYGDWLTPGGQTPEVNPQRELAEIETRLLALETNQQHIAETVEGIGVVHLVAGPPGVELGVEGDLAIERGSGTVYERMADDASPVWQARWVLPLAA